MTLKSYNLWFAWYPVRTDAGWKWFVYVYKCQRGGGSIYYKARQELKFPIELATIRKTQRGSK